MAFPKNTGNSQPTSLFGKPAASGTAASSSNIFGGGANTTTATPATSGGLFGGGNLFGSGSSTSAMGTGSGTASGTTGTQSGSLFDRIGQPASSTTTNAGTLGAAPGQQSQPTPTPGSSFGSSNPLFGGKNPASLFGGAILPPTQSASQPATTSTFGTTKPADQTAAAPKLNFFSTPPTTGTTSSETSKPADSATSAAPAAPTAGFGLFGKKPDAAASPFGVPLATSTPSSPTKGTATPSTTVPACPTANKDKPAEKPSAPAAAPSFSLFSPPKPEEKKDAGTPQASKEGEKPKDLASAPPLGSTTSGSLVPAAPTLGTSSLGISALSSSSTAVAVQPPSMLRGKSIEEVVNKWSADLDVHVREFHKFAAEVAVWDRALVENGKSLATLYGHVRLAEMEQNEIDQSLSHIEQQQTELAATLDTYEKSLGEILGRQGGSLSALDTGPADAERDKNFVLATDLHAHLDDLSASLSQLIEAVNELSLPSSDGSAPSTSGDDPMAQIAHILSNHLESLQWIESAVREAESKTSEVEKRIKDSGISASGLGSFNSKSRGFIGR